jgi:hypothetical protein
VVDHDKRNPGEIGFWDSDFWTNTQEGYVKKVEILSVSDINSNKAFVTTQFTIDFYNNEFEKQTKVFNMFFENGKWLIDDFDDYKRSFRIYLSGNDNNNTSSVDDNHYINRLINSLSEVRLSEADLADLSKKDLEIMRNSIYARYGYRFNRSDLLEYFSRYSWYSPTTNDMESIYNRMNDLEKYNIEFIKKHE